MMKNRGCLIARVVPSNLGSAPGEEKSFAAAAAAEERKSKRNKEEEYENNTWLRMGLCRVRWVDLGANGEQNFLRERVLCAGLRAGAEVGVKE